MDGGPTLYLVQGRAKPVLHGPNSTESNLFTHGETTYRVGLLSENPTLLLKSKEIWLSPLSLCNRDTKLSPSSILHCSCRYSCEIAREADVIWRESNGTRRDVRAGEPRDLPIKLK